MIICRNCGVELEPDMVNCPLCEMHVEEVVSSSSDHLTYGRIKSAERRMTQPQRKATWEIVSIIILFVITITTLLNFILNKTISWAEYPVAVCLVIFSYISVFSFLNKGKEVKILYVFILSSILIVLLDALTRNYSWSISLGIPLLFSLNFIIIGIMQVFKRAKRRGINLIAFFFLAAALLCICTEIVIDRYVTGHIKPVWSLIVLVCVLPVVTVLLFMHLRLNKGTDLSKIFHI